MILIETMVFIVWLSLNLIIIYARSEKLEYHFDKEKGIITYEEGPVFLYEYIIYIPLIITIPTQFHLEDNECGNQDLIDMRLKESIDTLISRLPSSSLNETNRMFSKNMLTPNQIKINHKYTENKDKYTSSRGTKTLVLPNNKIIRKERSKRFIFEIAMGFLAILALSAATGAITGSIALTKVSLLEENQGYIAQKINEQTEAINTITINQEQVLSMIKNMSEKVNEVIKNYNCKEKNDDQQISFIISWASIIPNSFIRAINSILSGRINSDVIPGEYLHELLICYPAFSNTIFEYNPIFLYQSSAIKLIDINKSSPQVSAVMSIPRILKNPLGVKITQKSCHWKFENVSYTLKNDISVIRSYDSDVFYNLESCHSIGDTTLCDKQKLRQYTDGCIRTGSEWNATGCPIMRVPSNTENKIIQTPYGIVVCEPGTQVTIFKTNNIGVTHTSVQTVSQPTLYTSKDANSILIGSDHYPITQEKVEFIIKDVVINHDYPNKNHHIDPLLDDYNISKVHKIDQLELNHQSHVYVTVVIVIIIIVTICVVGYLIFWNKKREEKQKIQLGYLHHQLKEIKSSKDDESIDL